jgi:V/A-type H+-transporting ATPase subunit C
MPDFEYANARLRAMRSNLLDQRQLDQLSQAGSLAEFIRRLAQTRYQQALEVAFLHASELTLVFEAVRLDFNAVVSKIRSFYRDDDQSTLVLILRGYDIHNLKSVLRGLAHHLPPAEIRAAFYPPGELSEQVLAELLPAGSPRAAIDRLASLGHPYAAPLVALRAGHPGADLFEMDLALDQWRHTTTRRALRDGNASGDTRLLLNWLDLDADLSNLLVVLRFIHAPSERSAAPSIERLLVTPGKLPVERLSGLAKLRSLPAAGKSLDDTWYGPLLAQPIQEYQQTNRLSALEAALRRRQSAWQVAQIAHDPLGVGVLLGYLALKTNESANLRRIAAGLWRGTAPEAIRAGLEELA